MLAGVPTSPLHAWPVVGLIRLTAKPPGSLRSVFPSDSSICSMDSIETAANHQVCSWLATYLGSPESKHRSRILLRMYHSSTFDHGCCHGFISRYTNGSQLMVGIAVPSVYGLSNAAMDAGSKHDQMRSHSVFVSRDGDVLDELTRAVAWNRYWRVKSMRKDSLRHPIAEVAHRTGPLIDSLSAVLLTNQLAPQLFWYNY